VLTVATVDISYRGNPAIYIPSAMLFILFSACTWYGYEGSLARRNSWYYLAVLFLFASAATYHLLSPGAIQWLGNTAQLYVLWSLYLLIAGALAAVTPEQGALRPLVPLIVVAVCLAVAAAVGHQMAHYVAATVGLLAMAFQLMAPAVSPATERIPPA
jgi:hypothetical protein